MEKNIARTLHHGERVSSSYAEIYLDDSYCEYEDSTSQSHINNISNNENKESDEWNSPSDLLIGIIDLKPPFTSKITRGITHEGILAIGNQVLEKERKKFLEHITEVLNENDAAWNHILEHEKAAVSKKVKEIYLNIFETKRKIMSKEIVNFYESSLQELEDHLHSEVQNVLVSAHAKIVSDLNTEIHQKLKKEKLILEEVLQKKYKGEIQKIKKYYRLLLRNELNRNNQLVNHAILERNEALSAFCRQIEAENITSTLYVMCTERKKCRIKQFILENYQSTEMKEKFQKIKERQNVIDAFKEKEIHISEINREWEDKIKKVLQLFLKFISFSLKLLPEQTTFLLDFEKMVILQLNEMQKIPKKTTSILIDEEKFQNIFKFEQHSGPEDPVCETKPFTIIGDLSDPTPPRYGSRETLPPDVDLPIIRLQRQFIYAKCHKFEEIKKILESQRCKCSDMPSKPESHTSVPNKSTVSIQPSTSHESESSNEPLLLDDIQRLCDCPVRKCKDWAKRISFPYLESYLDFTEDKFERVKTLLGKLPKKDIAPEIINPKDLAYRELPFSATKERYHTVGTQYSSREDLYIPDIECPCIESGVTVKYDESTWCLKESASNALNDILTKRKNSLKRLIQEKPNLLKMFTDECFDFQL